MINGVRTPDRILVIDDDHACLSYARRLLGERFRVDTARSIASAVERAQQTRYDVVILDLQLDGTTGADTVEDLQVSLPNIPIVAWTGSSDDATLVECLRAGATEVAVKGRDDSILPRLIMTAFARTRAIDAQRTMRRAQRMFTAYVNASGLKSI